MFESGVKWLRDKIVKGKVDVVGEVSEKSLMYVIVHSGEELVKVVFNKIRSE